ncbi:MAG: HAD family phosphatase [Eubacteriales bacterium]|nr:HAD family phosphatase [Eubacteriales bacterium]
MRYEAVIFDMDGVIFDSERLVTEAWKEVASRRGIPDIEEVCIQCLGINAALTRETFLRRYGTAFPYEECQKEVSDLFHSRYDGGRLPTKPGVRRLLTYLSENGWLVGLASSTRRAVVTQEITDAGLLPFFGTLTCGDMVSRSKPEPDIFLKACENLGVEPERAFAVEDSFNGVRAASRAGMTPIMVPDMAAPDEEMRRLAHVILPTLVDVRDWLQRLPSD